MKRLRIVEVGQLHELYEIADDTLTARADHDVAEPHDHDDHPPLIWQLAKWQQKRPKCVSDRRCPRMTVLRRL